MTSQLLPAWIKVVPTPALPCWRLVGFEYIDVDNPINNGSTNIYIRTLDKQGKYQQGIKVWQEWPTDRTNEFTKKEGDLLYNNVAYGVSFFQSGDSSFDPNKGQAGPYTCYADGASDKVSGMGLPLKRHVQYTLTFQWVDSPIPPPTTKEWHITAQSASHVVLDYF